MDGEYTSVTRPGKRIDIHRTRTIFHQILLATKNIWSFSLEDKNFFMGVFQDSTLLEAMIQVQSILLGKIRVGRAKSYSARDLTHQILRQEFDSSRVISSSHYNFERLILKKNYYAQPEIQYNFTGGPESCEHSQNRR